MMQDRVTLDSKGNLDEIVGNKGAHLESMGGDTWYLSFMHDDGTETVVFFQSQTLKRPEIDKREWITTEAA